MLAKTKDKEIAELHQTVDKLKETQVELQKKLDQADAKAEEAASGSPLEIIQRRLRGLSKASLSEKSEEN